jgi:hypothetical protein
MQESKNARLDLQPREEIYIVDWNGTGDSENPSVFAFSISPGLPTDCGVDLTGRDPTNGPPHSRLVSCQPRTCRFSIMDYMLTYLQLHLDWLTSGSLWRGQ